MAKILVIEPHKILRQAISLSLFPEHEVHVEEGISASEIGSLKEYDLLIVDGAALRESDRLTPELARAIQGCKTPTLWLEEDEASYLHKREKLWIVKKPIQREAFQSALEGLLCPKGSPRERDASLVVGASAKAGTAKGAAKKKRGEVSQQAAFQFIDLVEVVEEQPPPRQGKRPPRKSK